MKFRKLITLVMVLSLVITLSGCGALDKMKQAVTDTNEEDIEITESQDPIEITIEENTRDTVLYYKNRENLLVPVKRKIPWETGIAKAALRNMVDTEEIRNELSYIGLEPIIPMGTDVIGMSIDEENGICKVNFTSEILNSESEEDEMSLVNGIVYTLTEFPTISEVQLMVEGKIMDNFSYGTEVSNPIKRRDINLVEKGEGNSKVVVYYKSTTNGEYEYYVPVTIPVMAPNTNVYTALEELFNGAPELTGLYTDIPIGVSLQGVEVKDGIAFVDLSEDVKDTVMDQATFDSMQKNIALTLDQFNEIQNVKIMINGKTLEEANLDIESSETIPVFANEY